MEPEVRLSRLQAVLVAAGLVVSIVGVGLLDFRTGDRIDLTLLYLLPLLAATSFLGLDTGLAAMLAAALAQFAATLLTSAVPPAVAALDALGHALVFALVVAGSDRLLRELRAIRRLEGLRDLDLETARRAHESLVGTVESARDDIDVAAQLWFLREVGGDYYWFEDVAEDSSFVCLGDISGKGVVAALFTSLLDQSVRHAVERTSDLADIVARVNGRVHDAVPSNMFVTLFSAVFRGSTLTWLNAGHEPALLWRRRTGGVELLQTQGGLPLGVAPEIRAEAGVTELEPGDVLLAVTDGVTESPRFRASDRRELERVLHRAAAAGHSASAIVAAVHAAVETTDGAEATDDIAIVCLRYTGAGVLSPQQAEAVA
jgi:hypothetical protein